MSKFWLWDFYWDNREVRRSPANYAAYVRKCAAEPQAAYFLQNSARAGAYPEGPGNGWRFNFVRLPVHGKLLKMYDLDKIAGQGSAFERSLRMMDWLCAHTHYSGMSFWSSRFSNKYFQGKIDSVRILRFAYDKPFSHSLNCGHVAYILADCLMAVGLSAIPISMMNYTYRPGKDEVTPCPNHTVVHVWIPEEHRWIMLDPSFNAYITGKEGLALNLIEIQACHRKGESLRVAQYNFNQTQDCKREYLDGFIFGCLLEIMVEDGSRPNGRLSNRLLPEDVPLRNKNKKPITATELLAEPHIEKRLLAYRITINNYRKTII